MRIAFSDVDDLKNSDSVMLSLWFVDLGDGCWVLRVSFRGVAAVQIPAVVDGSGIIYAVNPRFAQCSNITALVGAFVTS